MAFVVVLVWRPPLLRFGVSALHLVSESDTSMATSQNPGGIPLWGGFASFIGSPWRLYTTTKAGYTPLSMFYSAFSRVGLPAPLRQRLISTGISTAGVPLSDLPDQDPMDLPSLDDPILNQPPDPRAPDISNPGFVVDWSLNPLKIVFRSVLLPIIGLVDFAMQRSVPVVYTVVSLVYQSLPLSSITRIARSIRILHKSKAYLHAVPPTYAKAGTETECEVCFEKSFHVLQKSAAVRFKANWSGLRCGHYNLPIISHMHTYQLSRSFCTEELDSDVIYPDYDHLWLRGSRFDMMPELERVFAFTRKTTCTHPILGVDSSPLVSRVPTPTPDSLYTFPPSHIWKGHDRANGVRCVRCSPNTLHSWDENLLRALKGIDHIEMCKRLTLSQAMAYIALLKTCLNTVRRLKAFLTKGETYFLLSVTQNVVEGVNLIDERARYVVLVDSDLTRTRLVEKFPCLGDQKNLVLRLPTVGNPISFAGWRLVVVYLCPIAVWFHIRNASIKNYTPYAAAALGSLKRSWSSCEVAHTYPFYMGNALVYTGYVSVPMTDIAMMFLFLGGSYGWDEIVPALLERCTVVLVNSPGIPEIMAPLVSPTMVLFPIVNYVLLDGNWEIIDSFVTDFTRENIYLMKKLSSEYVESGRVTVAHAFSDPRPISTVTISIDYSEFQWFEISPRDPRFRASTLPGENILAEISHSHGGIVFFTFGSRGDRNPIIANARYLSELGARVTVIHLNTVAEGLKLASVRNEDTAYNSKLFTRARSYVTEWHGPLLVTPYQLLLVDTLSYSLAPPDDIIYPFTASVNPLVSLLYSLFGLIYVPNFRIGAFAEAGTLPTSVDGKKFLESQLNEGKQGSKGAYWGGDGAVPQGYEHIPVIPVGDHTQLFKNYETLYCSGTVGAVSLGAASGCKVVVVGGGLDREYRNPYDAGSGFVTGQDPDNIFLALSHKNSAYFGVWLRANWYNVRALWAWFGPYSLGLFLFRLGVFYLFMNSQYKRSFLSTTPVSTILLMFDGRAVVPFRSYVLYLTLAKVCDVLLTLTGKNYLWLASQFVRLNTRLVSSALALWISQRYSWGAGLFATVVIEQSSPALGALVTWLIETFTGSLPLAPGDEYAVLELVLVYRYIPVVHARLLFEHSGQVFEGTYNAYGLYTGKLKPGRANSVLHFPTKLTLNAVRRAANMMVALPYGPTWNCYTVILQAAIGARTKLGIMAPFIVGCETAGVVLSGVTFVAVSLAYSLISTIPFSFGVRMHNNGVISMLGGTLVDLAAQLETQRAGIIEGLNRWYTNLTYLLPLPIEFEHKPKL